MEEDKKTVKMYQVDLYQSHVARSHTETFQIEATSEEEARKKAEKMVKDKGIEKDYDLEVTDPSIQAQVDTAVSDALDKEEQKKADN